MRLRPESMSHWRRDGFLRLPGFLHDGERQDLRAVCDGVLAAWQRREGRGPDAPDVANMAWLTEPDLHSDGKGLEALLRFVADDRILDLLARIAGPGRARFQNTQYFFEPRQRSWTGIWHRDTQFSATGDEDERRRMQTLTGVHFRVALVEDPWFEIVPASHARWDTPEELAMRRAGTVGPLAGARRLSLAAGDALLFHGWSIHRGTYSTTQPRRTLDTIYEWGAPADWSTPPVTCFADTALLARLPLRAQAFYTRFIAAHEARWRGAH